MTEAEYLAAKEILKGTNVSVLDMALLVRDMAKLCGRDPDCIQERFQLVIREFEQQEKSVSFAEAVERVLKIKADRKARTLSDIRQLTTRMMNLLPGLAEKKLASIRTEECRRIIETCFQTTRQRFKARVVLNGIFSVGCKKGWCSSNPVAGVEIPSLTNAPAVRKARKPRR